MKTINDFDLREKKVLVRCDFNVPLDEQGNILDDFKIKETLPTIKYLIQNEVKVILMSHLGDPEGEMREDLRMEPIRKKLVQLLGSEVLMAPDCVGKKVEKMVEEMKEGEVLLLENLRFNKGEEENSDSFSKDLAKLADIYINDAFGTCHREHASILGVAKLLPAGAGLLLEKEITTLKKMMENPAKPLIAIIGGEKVETKARFINKISEIADFILISGLIKKEIEEKSPILSHAEKIIKPVDECERGRDIGPKTIEIFKEKIKTAKTVFWNGPFGKTEEEEFSRGTQEIANAIIESKAFSVVGGGETVEFLSKLNLLSKFNHVSTGGGAMLSFLSGEELPGLEALKWHPSLSKKQVFSDQ
ncbi:MAG: phosphoglycerate kinase [Candidatus Nealsonbacteria bacterium]|nr:phosphoglycerate kinase [Candidatus Nealsonbacteria bacterium]